MNLIPVLRQRYFDSNGLPLAGGKLYSYQAGTTTPQATYTDQSGGTPNANPVILDSTGSAFVWVDPSLSYKFVLQDANGVQQWSIDNVIGLLTANAVGTTSIQDGAVISAKLAANSVTSSILQSDGSINLNRAVTTNSIQDGAVTGAKLASGIVDNSSIQLSSGVLSVKAGGITQAALASRATGTTVAAGGVAISADCGSVNLTTSFAAIANLSATITTTGRPVKLMLQSSSNASNGSGLVIGSGNSIELKYMNGASQIGRYVVSAGAAASGVAITAQCGGFPLIDTSVSGTPGTYTYTVQGMSSSTSEAIKFLKLVAYEI